MFDRCHDENEPIRRFVGALARPSNYVFSATPSFEKAGIVQPSLIKTQLTNSSKNGQLCPSSGKHIKQQQTLDNVLPSVRHCDIVLSRPWPPRWQARGELRARYLGGHVSTTAEPVWFRRSSTGKWPHCTVCSSMSAGGTFMSSSRSHVRVVLATLTLGLRF